MKRAIVGLLLIHAILAQAHITTGLKLTIDLSFEDTYKVKDSCNLNILIDNQQYVSYLGKKGAVACFAAPKEGDKIDFATIPKDRQYPGFIVSGTLPTKNDTDDLFEP